MKQPKHIRTEPIKSSITGKRIGTTYIYAEKECINDTTKPLKTRNDETINSSRNIK